MTTLVSTDPQAVLAGHLAVLEDYGDPQAFSTDQLQSLQGNGTLPVPAGWSLDAGHETTFSITIIDQTASGQTSVTATVSVIHGFLSRGSKTIEFDVTPLKDPTARAWARYVEVTGTLQPVPLGQGFASGNTAVIDRGDSLLRATYAGGTASELPPDALQQLVYELLNQLT